MSIDPPAPSDVAPEGGEPWEWLLNAAPSAPQARAEWAHSGAGWFTPGTMFSAVSFPAGAVHAAIGNWSTMNEFAEHLTDFVDGLMFYQPRMRADDDTYTGLVPYSVGRRWDVPFTTVEPADRTRLWWVISVEQTRHLYSTRAFTPARPRRSWPVRRPGSVGGTVTGEETRKETFRRLDDAIRDVDGGGEDAPAGVYIRGAFVHPEGGGPFGQEERPGGSRVSIIREWAETRPGFVRLWVLPVGPRAAHLTTVMWVGSDAEVQARYATYLSTLAAVGWHILAPAGSIRGCASGAPEMDQTDDNGEHRVA
ncbi:hypothetical protein [Embleya sp. NPDC059237]|uniref:hypothetical protein n=1 Tax=Embleya sp. NPDC059237 TaxID=3346784 RepID=UPI0036BE8401